MIEIKSYFTDWHEVDKETAKKYVMNRLKNMTYSKKIDYINKKFLRGITVEELCTVKELTKSNI